MILRFIGDVHGKINEYLHVAREADYSVQVGDLGWSNNARAPLKFMKVLDAERHKVIGGNHDWYAEDETGFYHQTPHFLGDFGIYNVPGFGDMFFVRGERSIDVRRRVEGRDWWRHEELNYQEGKDAIDLYTATRPQFVVTHGCPSSLITHITGSSDMLQSWGFNDHSSTAELLQQMWEIHQPKTWMFGHYHKNFHERRACVWTEGWYDQNTQKERHNCFQALSPPAEFFRADTTEFVCLEELAYTDFELRDVP
tara:strand:- start:69 stop:830 length:762 start_codon:yes stop_codon:yes gene_type:complete